MCLFVMLIPVVIMAVVVCVWVATFRCMMSVRTATGRSFQDILTKISHKVHFNNINHRQTLVHVEHWFVWNTDSKCRWYPLFTGIYIIYFQTYKSLVGKSTNQSQQIVYSIWLTSSGVRTPSPNSRSVRMSRSIPARHSSPGGVGFTTIEDMSTELMSATWASVQICM